jgi:hypothetical protein
MGFEISVLQRVVGLLRLSHQANFVGVIQAGW